MSPPSRYIFVILPSSSFDEFLGAQTILIAFGSKPPSGCSFDFSTALVDVSTMVSVARVVENVGVGAYLGAAHLIQDPRVLTAAASIVTIESRHNTILNIFEAATAISQPFDIPLLPNEVLAIAGSFIKGCDLGIPGTFSSQHFISFPPRSSLPLSRHQLTLHSPLLTRALSLLALLCHSAPLPSTAAPT